MCRLATCTRPDVPSSRAGDAAAGPVLAGEGTYRPGFIYNTYHHPAPHHPAPADRRGRPGRRRGVVRFHPRSAGIAGQTHCRDDEARLTCCLGSGPRQRYWGWPRRVHCGRLTSRLALWSPNYGASFWLSDAKLHRGSRVNRRYPDGLADRRLRGSMHPIRRFSSVAGRRRLQTTGRWNRA